MRAGTPSPMIASVTPVSRRRIWSFSLVMDGVAAE
jgi:hypothetical protein